MYSKEFYIENEYEKLDLIERNNLLEAIDSGNLWEVRNASVLRLAKLILESNNKETNGRDKMIKPLINEKKEEKMLNVAVEKSNGKNKQVLVKNDVAIESLISQAIEKNLPVETMERLLAMRTQLKQEIAKEEYNIALANFQAECPIIVKNKIVKNKDGRTVRYRYASLDEIIGEVKCILNKHGFSYSFQARYEASPDGRNGAQIVTCTANHINGWSSSSEFRSPIDRDAFMSEVQKQGAALTFAKRYAFCSVFGIMTSDEDNESNLQETSQSNIVIEPEIVGTVPQKKEKTRQELIEELKEKYGRDLMKKTKEDMKITNKLSELSDENLKMYIDTLKGSK